MRCFSLSSAQNSNLAFRYLSCLKWLNSFLKLKFLILSYYMLISSCFAGCAGFGGKAPALSSYSTNTFCYGLVRLRVCCFKYIEYASSAAGLSRLKDLLADCLMPSRIDYNSYESSSFGMLASFWDDLVLAILIILIFRPVSGFILVFTRVTLPLNFLSCWSNLLSSSWFPTVSRDRLTVYLMHLPSSLLVIEWLMDSSSRYWVLRKLRLLKPISYRVWFNLSFDRRQPVFIRCRFRVKLSENCSWFISEAAPSSTWPPCSSISMDVERRLFCCFLVIFNVLRLNRVEGAGLRFGS